MKISSLHSTGKLFWTWLRWIMESILWFSSLQFTRNHRTKEQSTYTQHTASGRKSGRWSYLWRDNSHISIIPVWKILDGSAYSFVVLSYVSLGIWKQTHASRRQWTIPMGRDNNEEIDYAHLRAFMLWITSLSNVKTSLFLLIHLIPSHSDCASHDVLIIFHYEIFHFLHTSQIYLQCFIRSSSISEISN